MNSTVLVVGGKEDYYAFVAQKPNRKDFIHLSFDFNSLRGQNLKDVIFLENWMSNYDNIEEMLACIIPYFRGDGYNQQTFEKIKFALSTYQHSYEEKLRIEHKVKKEVKDKELSEWLNAFILAMILFFSLLALMKCAVG